MSRSVLLAAARVILSIGLLGWLLGKIDFTRIVGSAAEIDSGWIVLAVGVLLLQSFILAWRWHRVVELIGGSLPVGESVRLTFVGLFFNQALPTSIGGDALRIFGLHRLGSARGLALSSVFLERLTGLFTLGVLTAACLPSVWRGADDRLFGGLLALLLLATGSLLVVLPMLERLRTRWLPSGVKAVAERLGHATCILYRKPGGLAEILILGALTSLMVSLAGYAVGQGLNIALSFPGYIALFGGATLITVLPVSIGGWGVREAAMVGLMSPHGVPVEKAFLLSVLYGIGLIVSSLPGALVWLHGQAGREAEESRAAPHGKSVRTNTGGE